MVLFSFDALLEDRYSFEDKGVGRSWLASGVYATTFFTMYSVYGWF